jgi:hypothetical protein
MTTRGPLNWALNRGNYPDMINGALIAGVAWFGNESNGL